MYQKRIITGYRNDTRYNVVRNSVFQGPYIRHGALIQYYAHNNVIYNNTFENTVLDSIDLHGEDEFLNEIYKNTITGVLTGAGIGVGNTGGTAPTNHDASGAYNYIHDNKISNSREGIKVHMDHRIQSLRKYDHTYYGACRCKRNLHSKCSRDNYSGQYDFEQYGSRIYRNTIST